MLILPETKITTRGRRDLAIGQSEAGYVVVRKFAGAYTPLTFPVRVHPTLEKAMDDLRARIVNDSDKRDVR